MEQTEPLDLSMKGRQQNNILPAEQRNRSTPAAVPSHMSAASLLSAMQSQMSAALHAATYGNLFHSGVRPAYISAAISAPNSGMNPQPPATPTQVAQVLNLSHCNNFIFKCPACGKPYVYFNKLSKHYVERCTAPKTTISAAIMAAQGKITFRCKYCKDVMQSKVRLETHEREHEYRIYCHLCGENFRRPFVLERHIAKAHHSGAMYQKTKKKHSYPCPKCNIYFRLKNKMEQHKKEGCHQQSQRGAL